VESGLSLAPPTGIREGGSVEPLARESPKENLQNIRFMNNNRIVKMFSRISAACIFAGSLAVLTGCGGVSGSHSVSPASFLLPGLVHADDEAAPAASTLDLDEETFVSSSSRS
jgi:hypothetical protein